MKLFIHYGLYKAGSSYLQYICANNREWLKSNKVYFPSSSQDNKMEKGFISAGNALEFSKTLRSKSKEKLALYLKRLIAQALEHRCDKILLSAEDLAHPIATPDGMKKLRQGCEMAQIESVHTLGYFRDLVSHAISTYKHRGKSGRIPDFEKWLKDVYETPRLLKSLFNNFKVNGQGIEWTFRKFKKNSGYMAETFFFDWLKIEVPVLPPKPHVNESVTLSEVLILNKIKLAYPTVTDLFVDRLKSMASSDKKRDDRVEEIFKQLAAQILSTAITDTEIDEFNTNLKHDEKLHYLSSTETNEILESPIKELSPQLSQIQIANIINTTLYLTSFRGQIYLLRRKLIWLLKK